jgi:hypothetical protein
VSADYLFFFAFALVVFLAFDLAADFFGLAFAAVFFLGLAAVFLTTVLRFGAAATFFLAAFLAAGACLRRVGVAGSVLIMGAGAVLGSALSIVGAGVEEKDPDEDGAGGIAAEEPAAAPMAGALIAVSQPGVNISSRSRETGFARPQRGQCAS